MASVLPSMSRNAPSLQSMNTHFSPRKHEILTRSLRKMERTLDTVLRSLGNPTLAAGMLSRSPSPSLQAQNTQALINSPSPTPSPENRNHHASSSFNAHPSPKMHSLPDNALNPLGLLAEASLANRRAQGVSKSGSTSNDKVGVASDVYFKPGELWVLSSYVAELRSQQKYRSYDNIAIATTLYRTANPTRDAQLCKHGRGCRAVQDVSAFPRRVYGTNVSTLTW